MLVNEAEPMRKLLLLLLLATPVLGAEEKQQDDYRLMRFSATWCEPCKKQHAVYTQAKISELLKKLGVKDVHVDIDQHPEAAQAWGVETIPTEILVRIRVKNKATAVKRWGGVGYPLLTAEQYRVFVDPSKPGPEPPKKQ